MTLAFIYLFIATVFQLAWLYNMKRIKKGIWKEIKRSPKAILPILLYIVFSICNVVFLAMAMKRIPEAIAYAIWSGVVIGAAALIDRIISKKPMKTATVIFILMILLGVIGLRIGTT